MPDISYQMRLLMDRQNPNSPNSTMGALREFTGAVGNAWQGYEGGADSQDAVKYFSENPVTPETIQEFSSLHPRMPLSDVYKYASTVETTKKAQKFKDQWKTLQTAIRESAKQGKEFDFSKLPEILPDMSPEFLETAQRYKAMYPEAAMKEMKPGHVYQPTVGGRPSGAPISGPEKAEEPSVWVEDEQGSQMFTTPSVAAALIATKKYKKLEKKEKETPLAAAVAQKIKKGMTEDDAYRAVMKEDKEVNVSNEVDTFLGQKYPGYYTDKKVRQQALDYYATPEGSGAFDKFWEKRKLTAPPIYNVIQTPTGYTAVDSRNPQRHVDLGIKRPLSSKEADDLSTMDSINESVKKAKALYRDAYVGPVAGRIGGATAKIGVGTTTEEQAFRAANAELEKTLFDLGGKQLTEHEIRVLKPFIPSVKDPPITYRAKLKNFETKYNDILKKKIDRLNATGFGISAGQPAGGQPTRGLNVDINAINEELKRRGE